MKKTLKPIFAAALVCAAVYGASACNGATADTQAAQSQTTASQTAASQTESETVAITSEPDNTDRADTAQTTGKASIDLRTVDYGNVDITIEWGDSDTMSEIASNMWYGNYDGKVVKVDGIAEKLGSWSIMEAQGEGSKIGFGFELVDSNEYPVDGSRVELVGVIAPGGSMEGSRVLYVLPGNMTAVKEDGTAYSKSVEYSGDIDLTVEWGDTNAMTDLMNNISSYVGKVVKIDGENLQYFSWEIGEIDAEGTIYSIAWQLSEGDEYPPEYYHIQIVGEVQKVDDYGSCAIVVKPENIAVIEKHDLF